MEKSFIGYCPAQNKEYSIDAKYLDVSSITHTSYILETFYCEYNKYGDKCDASQCPIAKTIPNQI